MTTTPLAEQIAQAQEAAAHMLHNIPEGDDSYYVRLARAVEPMAAELRRLWALEAKGNVLPVRVRGPLVLPYDDEALEADAKEVLDASGEGH